MGNIGIRLADEIEARIRREALESGLTLSEYCRSKLAESEEVKPIDRAELNDKIATLGEFIVNMSSALGSVSKSLEGLQAKVEALEQAQSVDLNKIVDATDKLNSNVQTLYRVVQANQSELIKHIDISNCFIEAFIESTFQRGADTMNLIQQKALAKYKERYTQSGE